MADTTTNQIDDKARRRSRTQLLLIFAIAFTSLGGSYLLFYLTQNSGVWGTTNNGEFVDPPLNVTDLALEQDGLPLPESEKWRLLLTTGGSCSSDCEHALHQLRQLHVLLNKEAERVERALVTNGSIEVAGYLAEYPGLAHFTASDPRLKTGIYIVDPLGNLVFFYPVADAGKPVLEDLKKLLKLSQIG